MTMEIEGSITWPSDRSPLTVPLSLIITCWIPEIRLLNKTLPDALLLSATPSSSSRCWWLRYRVCCTRARTSFFCFSYCFCASLLLPSASLTFASIFSPLYLFVIFTGFDFCKGWHKYLRGNSLHL